MAKQAGRRPANPSPLTRFQWVGIAAAIAVYLLPWFVTFEGLSPEGHRVLSVFLMAIVLWVTESIPLHATAALIIITQILTVSNVALGFVPLSEDFEAPAYSSFYAALAHPVLMLFLGGFFLADGAAKYNLDRNLARVLLRPFGKRPAMIVLGLMVITAVFSMFMSNTATTATMMAVVIPVIAALPPGDRMRTGMALCIPIAANVGGIGTPVGTPPNAIALGAMNDAGITISFVQWMLMAMPFVALILLFAWGLLTRLFPCSQDEVTLEIDAEFDTSRSATIFYVTFVLTVLMWLSEPLHGIKSTIVGFLPVVILLSTRVFSTRDMNSIQWHVLWLVAGGIALGSGVSTSGLDEWMIGLISWEAVPTALLVSLIALVALGMSTVISNSATANLIIPIGMSLATGGTLAISPILVGAIIAIGCSLAMALPISTPPNAIAYSTGAVKTKDMAISGLIIGVVGWALFAFLAPFYWEMLGVV